MGIPSNINPVPTDGIELAGLFDDLKTAFASMNKGSSRDANLVAGGCWVDDTDEAGSDLLYIKLYDGTTDTVLFTVNTAAGTVTLPTSASPLSISKVSADAVGPVINLIKSRIASSGQINTGDSIGEVIFAGKDNTNTVRNAARIKALALENFTSSANGAELILEVIKATESAYTEILRVKNGLIGIGTTAPSTSVHVVSTTGVKTETTAADNTTPAKITLRKKRSSSSGQVASGDGLGSVIFNSTDNAGTEITDAASIDAVSTQTHTSSAHGTKLDFYIKKLSETSKTKAFTIGDTVDAHLILSLVSGGLKFPSTPVSSSDANTLDHYGEFDWTPAFTATGSNPTCSYSIQEGVGLKIGQFVLLLGRLRLSSTSGGSGTLKISGLPVATLNSSNIFATGIVVFKENWTTIGPTVLRAIPNSTEITALTAHNATNVTDMTVSNLSNEADIIFAFIYRSNT